MEKERQSLLEQLKLAFDRQFAKRSEALKPYDESQGDLFNEVECEAAKEEEVEVTTTTTTTTKKRGKRKPLPKTLPREVIELDLDDHEKQCACCQHSLHKIGEERSEKLEFSPAVLKVLEYVRPKYACRQCEQTEDNNHIVQKPAPQSIIPKSFCHRKLACQHHSWQIPIRDATLPPRVAIYPVGNRAITNHYGQMGYPSQ